MEFHPGKCQYLKITNKKKPINSIYKIHNTPISETDSAKYLGVVIDTKLKWKPHFSELTKKCNSTLSFIKRNLPKVPQHIKSNCYKTLIRPKCEYASAVWDPHHQTHIKNIEKIQKRAARFVTDNYIMESGNTKLNLETLGWDTLEERRLQTKLITFQKARLKIIDIPTNHLAIRNRQTRRGGDGPVYEREFSKIDCYIYSFYPSASQLWNLLPTDTRLTDDISKFSDDIKKTTLSTLKTRMNSLYK